MLFTFFFEGTFISYNVYLLDHVIDIFDRTIVYATSCKKRQNQLTKIEKYIDTIRYAQGTIEREKLTKSVCRLQCLPQSLFAHFR